MYALTGFDIVDSGEELKVGPIPIDFPITQLKYDKTRRHAINGAIWWSKMDGMT